MEDRPRVGQLIVPYMVQERRDPVDFKELDRERVEDCARNGKCGVCGKKIRRSPIAFIGPNDGRTCFADPWMHPACAEVSMQQCPFLSGRHDWKDEASREEALLAPYSSGMGIALATNWRAHQDARGAWHFEAVGPLRWKEVTRAEG